MGDDKAMTDEEKKLMDECELEFNNRYGDDDPDYIKYKNFERKKPPIVDPWFNKPVHSSSRRNYGHGRRHQNWERRYNDRGDRHDRHAGKHYMYQRNSRPY